MTDTKPIRRIAIIGTGVIGASWTALFLAKGLQVVATDPAPNAEAALRKFVENAWPALKRLGLSPGASHSNLKFTAALAQAVLRIGGGVQSCPPRMGCIRSCRSLGTRNGLNFTPRQLFLILAPAHLPVSVRQGHHGDAVVNRANQRA